jgi:glycosyltransferase involved in cell wall biosynthesis
MKVLALSAYYEPEIAASMYIPVNLYADMTAAGIHVTVIAPLPTRGVSEETRRQYAQRKVETKFDGRLTIHRFWMFREGKHPLWRALRYLLLNIVFIIKALSLRADVIFVQSTPPTQGAMAAVISRLKGIPFVYNIQDVFPDSLVAAGLSNQGSLLWRIGCALADYSYQGASKIIVISDTLRSNLLARGVAEDKIEVIENWVDTYSVSPIPKRTNFLYDAFGLARSKFYCAYCGNIGLSQNLDLLLDVAESLAEHDHIGFIVVGDGVYKDTFVEEIARRRLAKLHVFPFQPYDRISEVFSIGDVGLVISKPGVGSSSVPSKTWSIMAASRPVVASFDDTAELKSIIESQGCGVWARAGDMGALRDAILSLSTRPELCSSMGENALRYVRENLSRDIATKKYIGVLTAVGNG